MASLGIFNFGMLHLVDYSEASLHNELYFMRFIHVLISIALLCLHKMVIQMNSLIIINYDLHCGTDPNEVKYFTNPFLLKTLLFVMHNYLLC